MHIDSLGNKPATQAQLVRPQTAPDSEKIEKLAWPKELPERVKAVQACVAELKARGAVINAKSVGACFSSAPRAKVAEILETLASLGNI